MTTRTSAVFYLNGQRHEPSPAAMELMLADYLRETRRLTGTKIVCAEGDCGACTVLMARPALGGGIGDSQEGKGRGAPVGKAPRFVAVNACIMRVANCDGASIVTVEALGSSEALGPVQQAICDANGSQCGFCTPGFVVALAALTDRRKAEKCKSIAAGDAKNALTGNLCRCTGYAPIIAGATAIDLAAWQPLAPTYWTKAIATDLARTQNVAIAPPRGADGFAFAAPTKRSEVAAYLKQGYRFVSGGTDVGVQINKGKVAALKVLSLHLMGDLHQISLSGNTLTLGAMVSVAALRRAVEKRFASLAGFLDLFASPQIKNVATVVGNIANGSPIGDATTALMACGGEVRIEGGHGGKARWLSLAELYVGYRQLRLARGEWISGLRLQLPTARDQVHFFKTSQRKDLDISAVNAGLWLQTKSARGEIAACRLAVGGVGPTIVRMAVAEAMLTGATLPLTSDAKNQLLAAVQADIAPLSDLRGSAAFRRVVLANWLTDTLAGSAGGAP
ncbi:MAG: FAD binding domain-containing protein [Myxococcales bacterium]|nr:FAD binding domain-containing protein [Myxococcales bacterium]